MVLEKTLESPLDCKVIKPVNHKGNQSWIFVGRTDVEAETPVLWPPDKKGWLIRKDLDAGKGWRQEEKGTTEDEIVGWRHLRDEHEFEHTLGVGDGKGRLESYSPWGHKESSTTEKLNWLNWNIFNVYIYLPLYLLLNEESNIFPLYYWLLFLFIIEFQDSLYKLAGRTLLHICFANIWDSHINFSLNLWI